MRKGSDYALANKVGGIIAVGGSLGLIEIVKDLYFHLITNYMLPGDFVALYALNKEDYQTRPEGLKATLTLGRQITRLANQKFA
jgi:hypothetical protein